MGAVVRSNMPEPQSAHTLSLTVPLRIINAEIRQPKSEKGTAQHPSRPYLFLHPAVLAIDLY
jgi:hypothetical protein